MADLSIRWPVVKEQVRLFSAHPDARKVQIEPGYPGDLDLKGRLGVSEAMWVDEIRSDVDIPVMTGARMARDDEFTVSWIIRVAGHPSLDATMTRIEALAQIAEDVLAEDPSLDDMDGVVSIEVTAAQMTCGRTPAGFLGYGQFDVRVHSRLT